MEIDWRLLMDALNQPFSSLIDPTASYRVTLALHEYTR